MFCNVDKYDTIVDIIEDRNVINKMESIDE